MTYIDVRTNKPVDGIVWMGNNLKEVVSFILKHESRFEFLKLDLLKDTIEYKQKGFAGICIVDLAKKGDVFFYFTGSVLRCFEGDYTSMFRTDEDMDEDVHSYRFDGNKEIVTDTITINAKGQKKIIINL